MNNQNFTNQLNFKKTLAITLMSLMSYNVFSQGNGVNGKFTKGGDNLTSTEAVIGSTNNVDFKFLTNNQTRLVIDVTGVMRLINLAGSGTRLVTTDANGNFVALPQGNANHVLFGNGTWGAIPTQTFTGNWGVNGNKYFYNSGYVGIGTNNPQFPLDVAGDARIQNNLYINGGLVLTDRLNAAESVTTTVLNADTIRMGAGRVIAGTTDVAGNLNVDASHTLTANGDIKANSKLSVVGNADFNGNIKVNTLAGTSYGLVYSDPQGNLLKNIPNPNGPCAYPVGPCTPGSLPAFHNGNQMCGNLILGTCTNDDFVLKSNNVNAQFIKPNGSIGFGANFNANPSDPVAFIFSNGPVRARGNSVFGGPMYLFDGPTSPNGDWGIEYTGGTSAPQPGLNFWKPFGSTNGNNNILFLHDNNRIGVGTDNPSSRFTIDSWSDDGLKVMSDPSKKSLEVFNKSTNKTEFVVTSDGVLYAREIYVKLGTIPDYVFESTYKLPTINETQNYVQTHKHLKNMINRNSITEKGANLGEFQRVTLEKLEEAYLYIFQLNERIELLEKELLKSKQ